MRTYKIFYDVSTGLYYDSDQTQITFSNPPYMYFGEEMIFEIQYLSSNSVDGSGDFDDFYTGFAGHSTSSSAVVDNNFIHEFSCNLKTQLDAGTEYTTCSFDGIDGTLRSCGQISLENADGDVELVNYCDYTLVGTTYKLTLADNNYEPSSFTPTNTYASSTQYSKINEAPLVRATDFDATNKDTGLFSCTLLANSILLADAFANTGVLSSGVLFEHKVFLDGSAYTGFVATTAFKFINIVDLNGLAVPPNGVDYLTATQVIDTLVSQNIEDAYDEETTLTSPMSMYLWDGSSAKRVSIATMAGYFTGGGVFITSVNGDIGPEVVLDADDISDASTTKKFTNATDIARLANTSGTNTGDQTLPTKTSDLTNDSLLTDVVEGTNVTIDKTDPRNPVISATGGGTSAVTSVFTRTGAVVAASGDYTAAQVTNAFDKTTDTTDAIIDGTNTHLISTAQKNALHDAVTVVDTTTVDFTLTGQAIQADVIDASISNAKLANVLTATIKGRTTAGTGVPEDLTAPQVRSLINVEDGAQVNVATNLSEGLATENTVDVNSSTGSSATLASASTTRAGLLTKSKFDDVTNNTSARHDAVTVVDSTTVDISLTGQELTASVIDSSIGTDQLSLSVNTSLGKADSALQTETDPLSLHLDQTTPQTISNGQPIQETLTASELVATDASKKLQSLAVSTYPSLAELAYLKGTTSAIQTQLNDGLVEVVSSLPGSPTANKIYILTADDATAKVAPGEYVHDGTGWACSACWGVYDLGNITGSISTTVIPGVRYKATQTGAVTAWAITFTRPGGCDFTIAGEYALATPTMTSRTSKLFGGSAAWDDASTALKTISIEDDETYLLLIASEIVAVS